ncbi:hypothetical protein SAMN02745883_01384 [Caminicella sporogenes DSM 14501]|uniref:Uncharacterized protein n=1 Tax=Caminicella sporogenes DSM 14501 TaxID=1121266 RepID=A0A1M6Q4G3_9FIRM|nr:hypothetical protein [Caminicella sporogenes]RKD23567.1 hypothetical protein BET04_04000 [Caminicella sporogenes]SHK15003.1 hypothetical protein SAMN02745883_01384 [Caminicella sporogenes DSM 14501]
MYRLYCQNLKNYLDVNKTENFDEFRLKIIKPLLILADVEKYKRLKEENALYKEVNNLVYEINNNKHKYIRFDTFSWELWALDFRSKKDNFFSEEIINEQLKLINLILGTQYWI